MDVSDECRAALMTHFTDAVEDVRLLHGVEEDCAKDLVQLCKDVKPGEGRVVACLQVGEGAGGGCGAGLCACGAGLAQHCCGSGSGQWCFGVLCSYVGAGLSACPASWQPCAMPAHATLTSSRPAGLTCSCQPQVLTGCLCRCCPAQDKRADIQSKACKRQLLRLLGFAVEDYRFDYQGKQACGSDVQKFCAGLTEGGQHSAWPWP